MLKLFSHIVCLNLESRKDRRDIVSREFERNSIANVEFYEATPGGVKGFCKSMASLFRDYRNKGNILVFEDDVRFINDYRKIDDCLNQLPDNWDMIYLGANVRDYLKRHSENLYILKNAWTTHAVGYSEKMVSWLADNYDGKYTHPYIFDEWLRQEVQPRFFCYITKPMFCTQRPDYSDIWNRFANYTEIAKSQKYYAAVKG